MAPADKSSSSSPKKSKASSPTRSSKRTRRQERELDVAMKGWGEDNKDPLKEMSEEEEQTDTDDAIASSGEMDYLLESKKRKRKKKRTNEEPPRKRRPASRSPARNASKKPSPSEEARRGEASKKPSPSPFEEARIVSPPAAKAVSHPKRAPPAPLVAQPKDDVMPPPPATPLQLNTNNTPVVVDRNQNLLQTPQAAPKDVPAEQASGLMNTVEEDTTHPTQEEPTTTWRQVLSMFLAVLIVCFTGIASTAFFQRATSFNTSAPPCFRNNVHAIVRYQGVCDTDDPTLFPTCPKHALCYEGRVHDCRFGGQSTELNEPRNYYELKNGRYCVWTDEVHNSFETVLETVQKWTLAHTCREGRVMDDEEELKYPEPVRFEGPVPLFVLTEVTKQMNDDTAPFNVRHPVDAFSFVSMINDVTEQFSLSAMPKSPAAGHRRGWLGGGAARSQVPTLTSKPNIPPGTPLVGLSSTSFQQNSWRPLAVQCWWNGMPRSKKAEAGVVVDKGIDTTMHPLLSDEVHLRTSTELPADAPVSNATESKKEELNKNPLEDKATANKKESPEKDTPDEKQATKNAEPHMEAMPDKVHSSNKDKPNTTSVVAVDEDPAQEKELPPTTKRSFSLFDLGAIARTLQDALPNIVERINATANNTSPLPSSTTSFYSDHSAYYVYPTMSIIGLLFVLHVRYQQRQEERRRVWKPEIARLRNLALNLIQEATGGWSLTHLRDTVLSSADCGLPHSSRRHLERDIWPLVVYELEVDPCIGRSQVLSTSTGRSRTVLSWVGEGQVGNDGTDEPQSSQGPKQNVSFAEAG